MDFATICVNKAIYFEENLLTNYSLLLKFAQILSERIFVGGTSLANFLLGSQIPLNNYKERDWGWGCIINLFSII